MWVSNDLYGLLIVAGSLLTFLGLAEIWRKKGGGPEATRKFVHIFGGMVCLLIPFLIQSIWVVFVVIRANTKHTLMGIKRLSVPSNEIASTPVTSIATNNDANTTASGEISVIKSTGI